MNAMDADLSALLRPRLDAVETALARELEDLRPEPLAQAARWYPEAGGKRLRPVMALLACEAAGGAPEAAVPAALAIELVHNFSLVHDDIMDEDETRRGRESVHVKWDHATAILAGDLLLARAFEALARIPDASAHQDASRALAVAVRRLCEGQALDVAFETRDDVTREEYVRMIDGKTAVLFEAATRCGALASGADEAAVEALATYGSAFGLAFQVADDLLDVTASAKQTGKPWASDVRAGKRTLLALDVLSSAGGKDGEAFRAAWGKRDATEEELRAAVDALERSGAILRARKLVDEHAARADAALAPLPPSEAKDALARLNRWATRRGA